LDQGAANTRMGPASHERRRVRYQASTPASGPEGI